MPQTASHSPAEFNSAGRITTASRRLDAPAPFRLWHLTSLDAPTVAVVWSLAFAWAAGIRLPVWIPILLALAAWAVYIADRLLDARSARRTGRLHRLRERHRFHWRHRRIFIPLAIAATCAAAFIVVSLMPAGARERGSVLAIAALAYFTRVHSSGRLPSTDLSSPFRIVKKELLVGVLFTSACALPAFSRAAAQGHPPLWPLFAAIVFFALLAWLNCHTIERWESDHSQPAREVCFSGAKAPVLSASFMRGLKPPPPSGSIFPAAFVLALTGLLLACALSQTQSCAAALVVSGAVSALLLALLERIRNSLTPLALRVAADLVLLTPLALLLK